MKSQQLELVPFSPLIEKYFEKEKAVLKNLLKNNFVQGHHIGSTAIKSISAMPTLDILIEVHTLDGIEVFINEFERAGFIFKNEYNKDERLFLTRLAPNGIAELSRIHIFDKASEQVKNFLDFRDYLNAEPEVAKEYENIKLALIKQFPNSPEMYSAGKNEFIATVLKNIS